MKIAKANKKDMDAAGRLASILENVDSGYYPPAETEEEGDGEPSFFDPDDREHLRVFYERVMACMEAAPGGLFRVVWGFHTLMHNDIVDPDADALELHPRLVRGLEAMDAVIAQPASNLEVPPLMPERVVDTLIPKGLVWNHEHTFNLLHEFAVNVQREFIARLPTRAAGQDVLAERERQKAVEGWTPEHDDEHADRSMARAAACYLNHYIARQWIYAEGDKAAYKNEQAPWEWPDSWCTTWWKPKNPRRDLVRAAALVVAEIERLDRTQQADRPIANLAADQQGKAAKDQ